MTVKELRDILKDFDDDVDVMTKKTEILGNIGYVNSVRKDSYGFSELMYRVFCFQMNLSRRKGRDQMQIVIEIPESRYRLLQTQARTNLGREKLDEFAEAVLNGIQLPKGHGTLKDTDAICKDIISALGIRDENYLLEAEEAVYKRIKNAPTIIEADKEK